MESTEVEERFFESSPPTQAHRLTFLVPNKTVSKAPSYSCVKTTALSHPRPASQTREEGLIQQT